MAINLNDDDEGLFPRLGRLAGHPLYKLNEAQAHLLADFNEFLSRVPAADEDLTAPLALSRNATVRSVPLAAGSLARSVAESILLKTVRDDQPTRAGSVAAALAEVVRQMIDQSETVQSSAITLTITADGTNAGDGVLVGTTARGDGLVQELAVAEAARVEMATATAGTYLGVPNPTGPFDWDYQSGSGAFTSLTAASATADYPAGPNLLVNGGFDSWNGTTNPLYWTKTGTLTKEASLVYGSGVAACRAAAGDTPALTQEFNDGTDGTAALPAGTTSLAFCLRVRGSAALSGGVLTVGLWDGSAWVDDATGADAKVEITLNGTGTSFVAKSGVVRTPAVLPATLYLRVAVTTTPVGGDLIFDHLALVPVTAAYAGGPGLSLFAGNTAFAAGDGWGVATTNDRGGSTHGATFQTLFDRLFSIRALGTLLPSAGSETIPDTLITAAS